MLFKFRITCLYIVAPPHHQPLSQGTISEDIACVNVSNLPLRRGHISLDQVFH